MSAPQLSDDQMNELRGALDEEQHEDTQKAESEGQTEEQAVSVSEVPEKIKFKDHEYSQEELDELIGLGSRARELGNAHGGFDKFVSEFGKKSETIGQLKKQIAEANKPREEVDAEAEIEQARAAARKLGIVLQEDLESYYVNRRSGEKLLENCEALESSIDGSDGRPKFEKQKVLEFMARNESFTDPKKAYEAMYLDEIANWKVESMRKGKGGITTITSTPATKAPQEVMANKDNLRDLIGEALR